MSTKTRESLWYTEASMSEYQSVKPGITKQDKRNGNGYFLYQPFDPVDIEPSRDNFRECVSPRFTEFPAILDIAIDESSVLLEGKPGSGKSNICQDIERCSRSIGLPVLRFAMHINAGTARTTEQTLSLVRNFRNYATNAKSIFILDNVDYGGYRGSSRTKKNAYEYAETVLPVMSEAVADKQLIAIGTSHDEVWRQSKWLWDDPLINRHANNLMEAFASRYDFQGEMTEEAIVELLDYRAPELGESERIAQELGKLGLQSFFYANHLDPELFLDAPTRAIEKVAEGRANRYRTKDSRSAT